MPPLLRLMPSFPLLPTHGHPHSHSLSPPPYHCLRSSRWEVTPLGLHQLRPSLPRSISNSCFVLGFSWWMMKWVCHGFLVSQMGFWEFLVSWLFLVYFYLSLCLCVFLYKFMYFVCFYLSISWLLSSLDSRFWFLLLILIWISVFMFMLGFVFVFVILKGKIINLKFLCLWFVCLHLCLWFWVGHDGTGLDGEGLGVKKNPFIKRGGFR